MDQHINTPKSSLKCVSNPVSHKFYFVLLQAGLGLALAVVFVALNAATGNRRAAALATFCVVGTFSSAAGIGGAMLYWRLGVPVAVPLMLMLACGPSAATSQAQCRAHAPCQLQ